MDIVGFGEMTIEKIIRVNKIPKSGEEVFIKSIDDFPGGSAANTIAGLARLEIKTGFIGKIGDDAEGSFLLENMLYQGVDIENIRVSKGSTGILIKIVDERNKFSYLFNPGVNYEITIDDVVKDFSKVKILHITPLSGTSFETQKILMRELSNAEISIEPSHIHDKNGIKKVNEMIKCSDIVLINEKTLKLLTGMNYEDGARALIDSGIKTVAVRLGKGGCYVANMKEEHLIPRYNVNVVDTMGAGDAFNAGFLFGVLKDKELKECGILGNKVASFCIQKKGPRDGLPTLSEIR